MVRRRFLCGQDFIERGEVEVRVRLCEHKEGWGGEGRERKTWEW